MIVRRKLLSGVLAGVLMFGAVACEEDNPTSETEDITPEADEGGE